MVQLFQLEVCFVSDIIRGKGTQACWRNSNGGCCWGSCSL
jgi:hypothetical protein